MVTHRDGAEVVSGHYRLAGWQPVDRQVLMALKAPSPFAVGLVEAELEDVSGPVVDDLDTAE
jgi:hypothetical protein